MYNIRNSNTPHGRPRKIEDSTCRHLAKLESRENDFTAAEALKTQNIDASDWTAHHSLYKLSM